MPRYDYVAVYFDRKRNSLVIPLTLREQGFTVELDHPRTLQHTYSNEELGQVINEEIAYAEKRPFLSGKHAVAVWSKATGVANRTDFVLERYMIDLFITESGAYNICFHYHRFNDEEPFFCPTLNDPELDIQIPGTSTNAELGKAVLDILAKGVARFEPDFFEGGSKKRDSISAKDDSDSSIQDGPLPFGYKCSWLAIKSASSEKVIQTLGFHSAVPTSWKKGLDKADISGDVAFVSSPIDDYVLVIGAGDIELNELQELAREFEQVQFYISHRVIDYQAWAIFDSGALVRAYSFLGDEGQVKWDEGKQNDFERSIGLSCLPTQDAEWPDEVTFPNEENVIDIARHYGIDPLFRNSTYPKQSGYLCTR